jgi:hypothetical protein
MAIMQSHLPECAGPEYPAPLFNAYSDCFIEVWKANAARVRIRLVPFAQLIRASVAIAGVLFHSFCVSYRSSHPSGPTQAHRITCQSTVEHLFIIEDKLRVINREVAREDRGFGMRAAAMPGL